MKKFILASASPRRKELLTGMGIDFDIIVSEADESSVKKTLDPGLYVQELALLKASAAVKKAPKNSVIIGADTVVAIDGEILGKPANEEDAFKMLKRLSGRAHDVYTGYCVMTAKDANALCRSVRTSVVFYPLTDKEINDYILTGEPMDKAGAYGIQGLGKKLIERFDGSFNNVVGLPTDELMKTLKEMELI